MVAREGGASSEAAGAGGGEGEVGWGAVCPSTVAGEDIEDVDGRG